MINQDTTSIDLDKQLAECGEKAGTGNLTYGQIQAVKNVLTQEVAKASEIFIPVKGYEGLYEVSNTGRIRSIPRGRNTGRELKQSARGRNYQCVSLSKNGVAKSCSVHRVVAEAFLSNPMSKRTVNHMDKDPSNNHVANLEWATHQENERHAFEHGKVTWNKGMSEYENIECAICGKVCRDRVVAKRKYCGNKCKYKGVPGRPKSCMAELQKEIKT